MDIMDDSDTSSLSSVAPDEEIQKLAPIFLKAKRATKAVAPPPVASPPRRKREPSPPHEDSFADNPDVAFIVMFRSRFAAAFPSKLAHSGPQDIERAVSEDVPTPHAEALLCALLGLVLNRKKPVESGHHGRALEEAISSHKSQWPAKWEGRNPLHGPRDFKIMSPEERLYLLRTLIMWSLTSSEEISTIIKDNYKQNRHNDDENQPLSVQPWGRDGDKRRYFLIEGQDDTSFRVYREGPRLDKKVQWYSMAGDIEEVKSLASRLETVDGTQAARTLSGRMLNAVPRFEATEEKRRRREYRQMRRAQFTRPEQGFSLYEGRPRGKRMRYTFDDDEAFSDDTSTRRSARFSDRDTPVDSGPVTTLSGRQVKPRRGGEYGASLLSGQADTPTYDEYGTDDSAPRENGRSTRLSGRGIARSANGKRGFVDDADLDESPSEDDDPSGEEWDSEANDNDDYEMPDADDEDDEMDEASDADNSEPKSLVVKLKVSPRHNSVMANPIKPLEGDHTSQNKVDDGLTNGGPGTISVNYDAGNVKPEATERHTIGGASHFDSPSHQQGPSAQVSMSGYPTPASLPPPAFKPETQSFTDPAVTSAWPPAGNQVYQTSFPSNLQPVPSATVTEHRG